MLIEKSRLFRVVVLLLFVVVACSNEKTVVNQGDIETLIADHAPGSHAHGGQGTWSSREGTDPEQVLNALDLEAIRVDFIAGSEYEGMSLEEMRAVR